MDYDIATGRSRTETRWMNKTVSWQKLTERLQKCKRTVETVTEYKAMSRTQKGKVKDIGGFVGGSLKDGVRKGTNVEKRSLITLDIDYGTPETIAIIQDLLYGTAWCLYSTHSHTPEAPRYRLILPLDRCVSPDEYIPIARRIADDIGIDLFDDSTYEPMRLMYWPSAPSDGEYVYRLGEGQPITADSYLATYDDWRDALRWPVSHRVQRLTVGRGPKQEDPTTKAGIIGAFCRSYGITEAIETFLPGIYTPTVHSNRWTFAEGSTEGGMIVYDDKFAYSHHGTDPCCEQLVNAFDLVRLHRFGVEDKEADPDTPVNRLPSFKAMEALARSDRKTSELIAVELMQSINDDFGEYAEEDRDWMKRLHTEERNPKKYIADSFNFELITANDRALKGAVVRDVFKHRDVVVKDLPWRPREASRYWTNTDDNGLLGYISEHYRLSGKTAILDAHDVSVSRTEVNPVKDYLNGLEWDGIERLDTLLVDYLGADDTAVTRAMTRKHFTAAVVRALDPGCKYDYILTLIGPEGLGKSSLIAVMGKEWFTDSLTTIEGKDGMEAIQGFWLCEIGELTNYKKSTSEAYKAFISKTEDSFRPAYARKVENFPRQCVFFATTNEAAFLKGDTGNRRFWTVECKAKASNRSVWKDLLEDRDQVWAEAVYRYKQHESLFLSGALEAEARRLQEEHNEVAADDRSGIIAAFLNRPLPSSWESLTRQQRQDYFRSGVALDADAETHLRTEICAIEVLNECFMDRLDEKVRYRTKEINQILRKLPGLVYVGRTRDDCYGLQRRFRIERKNEEEVL